MVPGKLTFLNDSKRTIDREEALTVIKAGLSFAWKNKKTISPEIFRRLCGIWHISPEEIVINLPKGRTRKLLVELFKEHPPNKFPRVTKKRLLPLLTAMLDTVKNPKVSLHTICEIIQVICALEVPTQIEWQEIKCGDGRTLQEIMDSSRSPVAVKKEDFSKKIAALVPPLFASLLSNIRPALAPPSPDLSSESKGVVRTSSGRALHAATFIAADQVPSHSHQHPSTKRKKSQLKTSTKSQKRLTTKEIAALSSKEKRQTFLNIVEDLRGYSVAMNNCTFITAAILYTTRTGRSLAERLRSTPSTIKDYCVVRRRGESFELNGKQFNLDHVNEAVISIDNESKLIELPLVQVEEKSSHGGKKIPVLSFQEFKSNMTLYTELETALINDAKNNGGISKGWVDLFHLGKHVNDDGHNIFYFATWDNDKQEGEVWYVDGQGVIRGKQSEYPTVFNKIIEGYSFIQSPDQAIDENTMGPYVAWVRDVGEDIIRVKTEKSPIAVQDESASNPFALAMAEDAYSQRVPVLGIS